MTATPVREQFTVVDELYLEFGDVIPVAAIRACVVEALGELRGSISRESLPEMAVRLARVRLAARAASRRPRPDRGGPDRAAP